MFFASLAFGLQNFNPDFPGLAGARHAYGGFARQAMREASYHAINNNPEEKKYGDDSGIGAILIAPGNYVRNVRRPPGNFRCRARPMNRGIESNSL
ncbi:MAG: hypothetical protein NTY09_07450 [bacterium]|nr:hypothetical protein [bacterium]